MDRDSILAFVHFSCPGCGFLLSVPVHDAGKITTCAECATAVMPPNSELRKPAMTYRDWLRERAARPQAVFAQVESPRLAGPAFASARGGALWDVMKLPNFSVLLAPGMLLLLLGGGVFWGLRLRDKPAAYLAVPALEERPAPGSERQGPPEPAALSAVGEPVELVEAALASAAPPPDEIMVNVSASPAAPPMPAVPLGVEEQAAAPAPSPALAQIPARGPAGENVSVAARVMLAHSFEPNAPDGSVFFCLKVVDPRDASVSARVYGRKGSSGLAALESGLAWGEEKEVMMSVAWHSAGTADPAVGYWEVTAVQGE